MEHFPPVLLWLESKLGSMKTTRSQAWPLQAEISNFLTTMIIWSVMRYGTGSGQWLVISDRES